MVFEEREKPEYQKKNLSEQRREPTTNSTHIWRRRRDLNTGHIGGRRVLSPLSRVVKKILSSRRIRESAGMCFLVGPVGEDISLLI